MSVVRKVGVFALGFGQAVIVALGVLGLLTLIVGLYGGFPDLVVLGSWGASLGVLWCITWLVILGVDHLRAIQNAEPVDK